jgi:PmbA protein
MIVQDIVKKAMKHAQGAQATMLTQESVSVDYKNDKLKSAESSQRTSIDVKVVVDGKVGISSTTDPRDMDGVVSRALEAAEFGSEAHFEFPGPGEIQDVKVFDPTLLEVQKPDMIRLGQRMMDMIKAYNSDILAGATVYKNNYKYEYANSKGTSYSDDHTDFEIGTGGELVRGTDILGVRYGLGQKTRKVDEEDVAARAIEYFRMAEAIVPMEGGEIPVIFTPGGLMLLLLSILMAVDGKNVHLGASPLRDKLNQPIADPRLTMVDDPLIDHGPNTSAFDDEGMPRRTLSLIEKGVLKNFIFDLDTAGRANAEPTGHGTYREYTNLVIEPGDVPYETMLAGVENGLLAHSFLGMGQGNPINGEFSVNVYLGYKIEKGKVVGRVKDVMLAGNVFDALKDITAISEEREWIGGPRGWVAGLFPYVQIGKLSVTAK